MSWSLPLRRGHLHNVLWVSLSQLLQQLQQQAGQGTPAASNSFGLGTAGTTGLALIGVTGYLNSSLPSLSPPPPPPPQLLPLSLRSTSSGRYQPEPAPGSSWPSRCVQHSDWLVCCDVIITLTLGMGNLGSAVLSAAAGQPKLGGMPSESLMQAYVNMQAPTGRESRCIW